MKEDINLLPPPVLHQRMIRLYMQRVNHIFWAAIIGILLIGLALGTTYGVLTYVQMKLTDENNNSLQQGQTIEKQIIQTNDILQRVKQFQENREAWTPLLDEVMLAAPTGITITHLELKLPPVDSGSNEQFLVVSGTATSRNAVVSYEQALRNLEWIGHLDAPLQNLATGREVTFSYSLYKK